MAPQKSQTGRDRVDWRRALGGVMAGGVLAAALVGGIGAPTALARQETAFLAAYAALAPLPDPSRLELLATLSLARHAWISLRTPGRGDVTEPVIALCQGAQPPLRAGLVDRLRS